MEGPTAAAQKLVYTLETPFRYMQKLSGEGNSSKPDTSWHDEMVRKANASFRNSSKRRGTTLKAQSSLTAGKAKSPKAVQRKPKQRK